MYQIAQSYIHFNFTASSEFKEALEKYLLYKGKIYANEFLHRQYLQDELKFEVQLVEGSLKSRLIVYGAIAYATIIGYGEFREGLDYLVNDARQITEHIVSDIEQEPNIDPNSIKRVERRLGVPGKLQRLAADIDYLKNNRANLTPKRQQTITENIAKQYDKIIEEVDEKQIPPIVEEAERNNINIRKGSSDRLNRPSLPPRDDIPYRTLDVFKTYAVREEEIKIVSEEEIAPFDSLPPPTRGLE